MSDKPMNTQETIDDLQAQLDSLKASLEPEPTFVDDGTYVPSGCEETWVIEGWGSITHAPNRRVGKTYAAMGLSFKHRENAIRKRNQKQAQVELVRLAKERDPEYVADFTDSTQKYYPIWNHEHKCIYWHFWQHIESPSFLHCGVLTKNYLTENHSDLLKTALGVWDE